LRWRCRQAATTLAQSPRRAIVLVVVWVARLIMQKPEPRSQMSPSLPLSAVAMPVDKPLGGGVPATRRAMRLSRGSFLEFAALQRGRCAISGIHPNVPTPGPPTSRAARPATASVRRRVQVNLRGNAFRHCGRPVRTDLGTRLHPVMSWLLMRGFGSAV
jgi:hypothetical protein